MLISVHLPISSLVTIDTELLEERISAILDSHRLGNHIFIFQRDSAEWLANNVTLIAKNQATLNRIADGITQNGDLIRRAPHFIQIAPPGWEFGKINERVVQIPLNYEAFNSVISRPIFLVEDIRSDFRVYEEILKNYYTETGPSYASYEATHGGGDAIRNVARQKILEKRIVLCVLDSDKICPHSADTKSESMVQFRNAERWPLFFFQTTLCSELENLFDLDVIEHVESARGSTTLSARGSTTLRILQRIENQESRNSIDPIHRYNLYFDMKRGVSPDQVGRIRDQNILNWITSKLALGGIDLLNCNLPGFGDHLVANILDSHLCLQAFFRSIRSKRWRQTHAEFVSKMIWILAAPFDQRL